MKPFATESLALQFLREHSEDRPCTTLFFLHYPQTVIVLTRNIPGEDLPLEAA